MYLNSLGAVIRSLCAFLSCSFIVTTVFNHVFVEQINDDYDDDDDDIDNGPGAAQFAAFVYDDKVKQCDATWRMRWKYMTTWCPERPSIAIGPLGPRFGAHFISPVKTLNITSI